MPFDNSILTAQDLLEAAVSASDLKHIDLSQLETHKADQIRQHPPSWMYRHPIAVGIAQLFLLIAGLVAPVCLRNLDLLGQVVPPGSVGIAIALLAFGLAIAPSLVPTRGPARWRENLSWDLREVHPEVQTAARQLKKNLPDVRFIVGELFQDRIRLDPYLVADYRGTRVLLGIWDGERLLIRA